MNDRIKCPKCKQETFENPKYYSVRGEMILFDGKCINCGYDVTTEELYNDLKKKYDFEEDFDIIKWPLENILEKCIDKDLNIKYLILTFFIRIYDDKLRNAVDHEKITQYFDKKIQYQQVLERRKFSEKETLRELTRIFENKPGLSISAKGYYEQIISLDPGDPNTYFDLARAITDSCWYSVHLEKAIKNYDIWFSLSSKNCDSISRRVLENKYLKNLAKLHFRMGISAEDCRGYLVKALNFLKRIDLSAQADIDKMEKDESAFRNENIDLHEKRAKELTFPVQVKAMQLQVLVILGDFEEAFQVYDEIDKINPGFTDHYCHKVVEKTGVEEISFPCIFNFYNTEDSKLFASLTQPYWETGKPEQIGKAYYKTTPALLKKDQSGKEITDWSVDYSAIDSLEEENFCDDLEENIKKRSADFNLEYKVLPSLAARSMFRAIQLHLGKTGKADLNLVDWCIHLFKMAATFYVSHFISGPINLPPLYDPLYMLIPPYREGMFECHLRVGDLYEMKNDFELALVAYREAQEYQPEKEEVRTKIENVKKKFINDFQIEVENLAKIETKDIPVDTTKRIISLLESIKSSFPEHYKETKILVEKIGEEMPYKLLNTLRCTAEEYFNKMYKGSKKKSFRTKAKELLDRNEINGYVKNLLELIWSVGSRGSHPPPAYVRKLKLEDIEVIISAEVRFLNWYIEKYSKQK
ncbi:MAG: DUF4145 domain-containing protein [candidate division Zixibacteria bacterium]|nr:DUF4145 domain-containing protein [candidate division Zixibacteria bacterium]